MDVCLSMGFSNINPTSSSLSARFSGVFGAGDTIQGGLGIRGGGVTDLSRSSSSASWSRPCVDSSSPEWLSSSRVSLLTAKRLITSSNSRPGPVPRIADLSGLVLSRRMGDKFNSVAAGTERNRSCRWLKCKPRENMIEKNYNLQPSLLLSPFPSRCAP